MLPFTTDAFFAVFEAYNRAIWPGQIPAYLLGAAVLIASVRGGRMAGPVAAGGLAVMWLVNGALYHLWQFSVINPLAYGFGALFLVQSVLFAVAARPGRFEFAGVHGAAGWLALVLIVYAAAIYPVIGWLMGHGYPRAPLLGVAPCPTTIFSLGILMLVRRPSWWLWPIPVAWALFGSTAAILLAVPEDLGMLAAALIALSLLAAGRLRFRRESEKRG